jgi:hypothetical protein
VVSLPLGLVRSTDGGCTFVAVPGTDDLKAYGAHYDGGDAPLYLAGKSGSASSGPFVGPLFMSMMGAPA